MSADGSTGFIQEYLRDMQFLIADLPQESIRLTVAHLYAAWERRRHVFLLGNGGSASTASHMANDLCKATIVAGLPRMKVIALTDNVSIMTAWANDVSYDVIFKEQLENLLAPGDTVIGISASGNSPNVVCAMEFAKARGAVTIVWTGRSGGRLREVAECRVHVPTEDVGMIESAHLVVDHLVTKALRDLIEARHGQIKDSLIAAEGRFRSGADHPRPSAVGWTA